LVRDSAKFKPRLLSDLARHGLFKALAGFDEARDDRVTLCRPMGLTRQQTTLVVGNQHNNGWIGPGKVSGATVGMGTATQMPALSALVRVTTDATEEVAMMPVDHGLGISQEADRSVVNKRSDTTQILKVSMGCDTGRHLRLGRAEPECDVGPAIRAA
jgi:hypothetical protein